MAKGLVLVLESPNTSAGHRFFAPAGAAISSSQAAELCGLLTESGITQGDDWIGIAETVVQTALSAKRQVLAKAVVAGLDSSESNSDRRQELLERLQQMLDELPRIVAAVDEFELRRKLLVESPLLAELLPPSWIKANHQSCRRTSTVDQGQIQRSRRRLLYVSVAIAVIIGLAGFVTFFSQSIRPQADSVAEDPSPASSGSQKTPPQKFDAQDHNPIRSIVRPERSPTTRQKHVLPTDKHVTGSPSDSDAAPSNGQLPDVASTANLPSAPKEQTTPQGDDAVSADTGHEKQDDPGPTLPVRPNDISARPSPDVYVSELLKDPKSSYSKVLQKIESRFKLARDERDTAVANQWRSEWLRAVEHYRKQLFASMISSLRRYYRADPDDEHKKAARESVEMYESFLTNVLAQDDAAYFVDAAQQRGVLVEEREHAAASLTTLDNGRPSVRLQITIDGGKKRWLTADQLTIKHITLELNDHTLLNDIGHIVPTRNNGVWEIKLPFRVRQSQLTKISLRMMPTTEYLEGLSTPEHDYVTSWFNGTGHELHTVHVTLVPPTAVGAGSASTRDNDRVAGLSKDWLGGRQTQEIAKLSFRFEVKIAAPAIPWMTQVIEKE